jgi:hypothetical protein
MLLLVPADPLRPRRPDDHFAAEAAAARDAGLTVALIDHDALTSSGDVRQAVARVPDSGSPAVYRGWMLRASQYAALAAAMTAKGVTLRTSAAQYRQAHELPGWYHALSPVTPASAWTEGDAEQDFLRACARLGPGPAVMRDYVKSMKKAGWRQPRRRIARHSARFSRSRTPTVLGKRIPHEIMNFPEKEACGTGEDPSKITHVQ